MPTKSISLLKTNKIKDSIDVKFNNLIEYFKNNSDKIDLQQIKKIDNIVEEIKNSQEYKQLNKEYGVKYCIYLNFYMEGQITTLKNILIPHKEITKDGIKFYWTYPNKE
jgi:hypothetical protein